MITKPTRKQGSTRTISWRSSSADLGGAFREEEDDNEDDRDEQ